MLRCTLKSIGIVGIFTLAGCATVENPHPQDPLEKWNRGMYGFNKTMDVLIVKPLAYVYKGVVPVSAQQGVGNFFDNLEEVTTIANDLLQFKFRYALQDTTRLLVNSTFGVGGLIDVASRVGLDQRKEDFGQTLYHWGYTESMYLVLPFLGPSTFRDTMGTFTDRYALSVWPWINDDEWTLALTALDIIDTRASLLQQETVLDTIAVDEYKFMRNAYLQRRSFLGQDQTAKDADPDQSDPFADFDVELLDEAPL